MPNTPTEGGFFPPIIETGRIINVNLEDWSVDVVTEHSEKKYLDIQVMNPYFHYMNGEGMYAMPEVGALVWTCKPSDGHSSLPFVLGFQSPHDEDNDSYRSGRQSLNPGDLMFRTRDENFVILRRGGAVQIGATPTSQRIYVPVQNMIRDFAESYQLFTFGGELLWMTDRDDTTTTGDAPTTFYLKAKSLANDPAHIATLSVGSHGEGVPTTLELVVNESGAEGAAQKVKLTITKEGDVTWDLEKDWSVTTKGDISMISMEGDVLIETQEGFITIASRGDMYQSSEGDMITAVDGNHNEKVDGTKILDCSDIKLGGPACSQQGILGNKLVEFLGELIGYLAANQSAGPGNALTQNASISLMSSKLSGLLAQKTKLS